ncbi:MAG: hypothetical protein ACKO34_02945 [Vampirovibrionales bacterium]
MSQQQTATSSVPNTTGLDVSLSNSEAEALLKMVQVKHSPLEKLKLATQQLEEEAPQRQHAQALLDVHPTLSQLPTEEQRQLREALREVAPFIEKERSATEASQVPWLTVPTPLSSTFKGNDLEFITLLAELVTNQLGERLSSDLFLKQAFHVREREDNRLLLAKHLHQLLEENQQLRQENQRLQQELKQFQPTHLGLFKKTGASANGWNS